MKKFIFGKFAGTNVYNVSMGALQCFDGREDSFLGGASFLSGGCTQGALVLMGGFRKYHIAGGGGGVSPCPPLWETLKGIHSTARIAFTEGKLF